MLPYLEESEWERKLQAIRHKHNVSRASMNHYKVKALSNHKFKPFQYDIIKKLTKERLQQEVKSLKAKKSEKESLKRDGGERGILLKGLNLPSHEYSPPPTKRVKKEMVDVPVLNTGALMQSALFKALNVSHPYLTTLNINESSSDSDAALSDLGYLPSPKDKCIMREEETERKIYNSLFKYDNTRIGDTLKDIIVKTISEKVKCKLESTDFAGLVGASSSHENQKAKETIMSAFTVPETSSTPPKKSRRESHPHSSIDIPKSSGSSQSQTGNQTKKTRPKRGQYRKYNSQLLTEAVKAVQRGEMSVHRAGSYYGVPHSTLEYKVKERHLLRQKKIKEQQELKQKQEEEAAKKKEAKEKEDKSPEKPNVGSASESSSNPAPTKPSPASSSWLPPFTGGIPYESAAALGLFGSGFALSTPASELLRKLQHKVQSKSDSGDESPGSSNYPSVTEGYIYIS